MYTLEGVSSVANFITAYEDSHFRICSVFFVSKGNLFDVYFCRSSIACLKAWFTNYEFNFEFDEIVREKEK